MLHINKMVHGTQITPATGGGALQPPPELKKKAEKLQQEFKTCQLHIENKLTKEVREHIAKHMQREVDAAIKDANEMVKQRSEKAYKDAFRIHAKEHQKSIEGVCHWDKWDREMQAYQKEAIAYFQKQLGDQQAPPQAQSGSMKWG